MYQDNIKDLFRKNSFAQGTNSCLFEYAKFKKEDPLRYKNQKVNLNYSVLSTV